VSEQSERVEVLFRCLPCRRRYGYAPVLAVVDRMPGEDWQVWAASRHGRASRPPALRMGGGPRDPIRPPDQVVVPPNAIRLGLNLVTSTVAQLACHSRRCRNRPTPPRAELIERAERANAAGRGVDYL